MALLPSDPKQQKAVFVMAGALVAFYAFWSFVHSGRVEVLEVERERLENLSTQNEVARVQSLRGGAEMQARAEEYDRHVRRLEELIPESEEVTSLVNSITFAARRMGLELIDVLPQPDEPGQHYTRQSYALEVVGDYHDVGRFMAEIASLERIIQPTRVTIASYDQSAARLGDFEAPIQVSFDIATYILPDASGLPGPVLPGDGSGTGGEE